MKTISFFFLLFCTLTLSAQQGANELVEKATTAYARGDYQDALRFLTDAEEAGTPNPGIHYLRAVCYHDLGDYDAAYQDLSAALELDSTFAEGYYMRGYLQQEYLKREEEAIQDYTATIRYSKETQTIYRAFFNRAVAKQQLRDFEGALEDIEALYERDSTDMSVRITMATILDDVGQREEALVMLREVAEEYPKEVAVLINIGFQLTRIGQCEEAVFWLEKALALDEEEALTWNNLGYARYCMGDYARAMEDVEHSLELDPTNSYAWRNKALIQLAEEQTGAACRSIEKALELQFTKYFGPEVEELQAEHCQ